MLQRLVAELSDDERIEVVEILTKIYLNQRSELDGGDSSIEINDEEYAIWIDSNRPITEIENAMFRWIADSNYPAAQQVATRACVSFANAIDQKEAQQIREIRELRKQPSPVIELKPENSALATPLERFRESKFKENIAENIVARLATLSSKHYNAIIKGLLPEVLAQENRDKQAMSFVLDKWRLAKDKKIKTIAELLDRAIWLDEHSKFMFIGMLALVMLVVLVIIVF